MQVKINVHYNVVKLVEANEIIIFNSVLFNPFAPEPPVTARADPGPIYPL